jgi:UDP:flavonoid glycosyltransferase YjiC (YdhE family)
MAQSPPRIVYLAVADARGHLMRAHLLRRLLAEDGVQVDIVTTSDDGQQFLEALGSRSTRISNHFHVEFGAHHDMRFDETSRRVASYLARPERGLKDLVELHRFARGAAFVVNDSLHPALLAAASLRHPFRVVHVAGENLWAAALTHFDRSSAPMRRAWHQTMRHARDNAFARITHTLGPSRVDIPARNWWLPPIVAEPLRSAQQVRASLGLRDGLKLAVVYLNPHYRDPAIAAAVEQALRQRGFALYGVSESFALRPGWVARDAALADAIAAADVYISGAGMGALEQTRAYGTPFVALLGSQPEQQRNLAGLEARGFPMRTATVGDDTAGALSAALDGLEVTGDRDPAARAAGVRALHRQWKRAFLRLTSLAANPGERHVRHRTRARNQQPAGRWLQP